MWDYGSDIKLLFDQVIGLFPVQYGMVYAP